MSKRRRAILALGAIACTVSACQGDTVRIGVFNTCDLATEFSASAGTRGSDSWHRVEPGAELYVRSVSEHFEEITVSIRRPTGDVLVVDTVSRASLTSVQPVDGKMYADFEYAPRPDLCRRIGA